MLIFVHQLNKIFSDKLMKPASSKSKKMFSFLEQETQCTSMKTSMPSTSSKQQILANEAHKVQVGL